ncbi:WRKY domain-containing protein [Dioscorea alata]|uniref:WRKY domain-containing protein n=1 Tax=Dioscorea alata TaxID=55571 RepID=A0ACB7UWW0_DIOAL|nr:WRKY domain-containing protein [Dioscorea alata]
MPGSDDAAAAPSFSSIESLFRGGTLDFSPCPMTLLSSFFGEDSELDCRSFSQLLAGAVDSSSLAQPSVEAGSRLDLRRAPEFPLGHEESPVFTLPLGISPTPLLLDSRGFFSSSGTFGMLDRQDLQSNSDIGVPRAEFQSLTTSQTSSSAINMMPIQQNLFPDQRSQVVVDKPADDGYNWRKYGQKQVKGSEYPRSYYKCTHQNCPVKKKVERAMDGQITEIIYKGQHNHLKIAANKRVKEGGGVNELNENYENDVAGSMSKRDREYGNGTSEQLSGSSDDEDEVDETEGKTDVGTDCEPNAKRMNVDGKVIESNSSHRTVTEPRIIVQTTSEVDLLDDGYRWRKYGQKVVKGNPHPRSYYKCTNVGCNVRKHVERASSDAKAVITTYEGKHNHEVPAARNSSHVINSANTNVLQPKAQRMTSTNPTAYFSRPNFNGNDPRSVALLQMKQEHEVT